MKKNYSIFTLLIKNIVLPAVLILLILAFFNIVHTTKILNESKSLKNKMVTNEISVLLEYRDISLELLEKSIDKKIKEKSNLLINKYFISTKNIEKVDLNKLREEIGMNSDDEDIYIINSGGIVVNTTFINDKNLSLFSFGEEHRKYLLSILNGGKFISERFTIETSSGRLRKYSYQPTNDGKYILEIGTYSSTADNMINLIQQRLSEISNTDSSIIHIDLIIGSDYPFSFNKAPWKIKEHRQIINELFRTKKNKILNITENNKNLTYVYIYMDRKNTILYKDSVIQIVIDNSIDSAIIRNEIIKLSTFFLISIIILIIIISKQAKVITKPLRNMVSATNKLLIKEQKLHFNKSNIRELDELSDNFSKMNTELTDRANELIKASLREQMKEKEAEVAYKLGLYESVTSYLHHIGNSMTEVSHEVNNIKNVLSFLKDYPKILREIKSSHLSNSSKEKTADDKTIKLINKLELLVSSKIIPMLTKSLDEILIIKEQMLYSLKEQQESFMLAKTQKSKLVSEIQINELISNVLKDYEERFNEAGITIKTNFEDNIIAYIQKQQVIQGINTIIKNAIEAIKDSKNNKYGIIEISTLKKVTGNKPFDYKTIITIKDNGIGISENNKSKLFKAGFTTKKMRSGLNLHNFMNFLNYNNGNIYIESNGIESGTTIKIIISNE